MLNYNSWLTLAVDNDRDSNLTFFDENVLFQNRSVMLRNLTMYNNYTVHLQSNTLDLNFDFTLFTLTPLGVYLLTSLALK